jgi:hypothetical protein
MQEEGQGCGVSAQINFGELTLYLTYGFGELAQRRVLSGFLNPGPIAADRRSIKLATPYANLAPSNDKLTITTYASPSLDATHPN